jgi:hypothetical protein
MCRVGQQRHRVGGYAEADSRRDECEIQCCANGKSAVTLVGAMRVRMMMVVVVLLHNVAIMPRHVHPASARLTNR